MKNKLRLAPQNILKDVWFYEEKLGLDFHLEPSMAINGHISFKLPLWRIERYLKRLKGKVVEI